MPFCPSNVVDFDNSSTNDTNFTEKGAPHEPILVLLHIFNRRMDCYLSCRLTVKFTTFRVSEHYMEWSHLVGSSSLWREFVVQVKFIIYHIFLGSCFTLKLLCMKFQTPAFQVARCLKPSLPSPALSLLGNPPSPQMPKSSLESYPARLQTKNLCFVFPDGKLVPLQRLARVLPVCVLHVPRLRLPSNPIKFASIAKSARCSTYHGAHRDSFSP